MLVLLLIGTSVAILVAPLVIAGSVRGWGIDLVAVGAFASAAIGVTSIADAFFVIGGLLLLAASKGWRLPRHMVVGALLVALPSLINRAYPPDFRDLPMVQGGGTAAELARGGLTNLARFEVGLLLVPLAIIVAVPTVRELWRIADAWILGACASAVVALTDRLGVTNAKGYFLQEVVYAGRESGLSAHPNQLALTSVMTLPLLLVWFRRPERRVAAFALTPIVLTAIWLTGSRGGMAAGVLGLVAGGMLAGGMRWSVRNLRWLGPALLLIIAAVMTPASQEALRRSRLLNGTGAGSDVERQALRDLSVAAASHRPLSGYGYTFIEAAHQVQLQLLASGGLLALVGFYVYLAPVVLRHAPRGRRVAPGLGWGLFAALMTWVIFGLVENQIVNRFLYVPVGLAVALSALASRADSGSPPDEAPEMADQLSRPGPARRPAQRSGQTPKHQPQDA